MLEAQPPVRFEKTAASVRRCSPAHGEHTAEVLREVGYDDQRIAELRAAGVLGESP